MEYLDLGDVYGKSLSANVEFEMENINIMAEINDSVQN